MIFEGGDSVVTYMTGLISMLLRTVWWQKVDFPEPGGPTNKIMFLRGISCNWVKDNNILVVSSCYFFFKLLVKASNILN